MNFGDYFLSTLGVYGAPALFVILLIGSVGLPMPASLLLLAAGSFVEQGELGFWPVLILASAGAIIGDNLGYMLGRWGGRKVARQVSRLIGGAKQLERAEGWLRRREGMAIFLSRWLLTPLGPVVNLTSAVTGYPWPRFLLYDVLGEVLWVFLYVLLGRLFSGSVQAMSELLGDFTWMIVGLLFVALLGRQLAQALRAPAAEKAKANGRVLDGAS